MSSAYDYLKWRGDLSPDVAPINMLDVFLCAQISMVNFEGILDKKNVSMTIREAAEKYFENHTEDYRNLGAIQPELVLPSLRKMSELPRFANAVISSYVNKISRDKHEQFSAITVTFEDGTVVIAFRGTDDTIIGWREDFEIALDKKVPSQADAVKYLEDRVAEIRKPDPLQRMIQKSEPLKKMMKKADEPKIYVGGHSKGGNLASYAILNCSPETYKRVTGVYSFDGPGFIAKYKEKKIVTVVSENSIIGMLMHPAGRLQVVKTRTAGPRAHDGYTWSVERDGFVPGVLSKESKRFAKAVNTIIINMSEESRERLINALFGILDKTGAKTLLELGDIGPTKVFNMLNALSTDREINAFVFSVLEIMYLK